jgi:hypothetical protein
MGQEVIGKWQERENLCQAFQIKSKRYFSKYSLYQKASEFECIEEKIQPG